MHMYFMRNHVMKSWVSIVDIITCGHQGYYVLLQIIGNCFEFMIENAQEPDLPKYKLIIACI